MLNENFYSYIYFMECWINISFEMYLTKFNVLNFHKFRVHFFKLEKSIIAGITRSQNMFTVQFVAQKWFC